MVSPVEAPKPSGGSILQKLPKLSTSIWLLIIVVLVLIAVVPMVTSYIDSTSAQGPLRDQLSQLQGRYASLQKQLSTPAAQAAQINQLKSDVDAARQVYGTACDSVATSQKLLDMAWDYDITITNVATSTVSGKISGKDYSGTSYVLTMSGQVASFQNYLIAVGNKFASSKPTSITISPATEQGALDKATLTIWIVCNQ